MEDGRKIDIVDLHSAVIHECGEPPYETCSIMKRPRDVVRYFSQHLCPIYLGDRTFRETNYSFSKFVKVLAAVLSLITH